MSTLPDKPCCHSCGKPLDLPDTTTVGRGAECDSCGADVRVCLNCRHYDPSSYNECAEPMAERVVDKGRRNFCDYFSITMGAGGGGGSSAKEDALKKLDDLFK